VIDLSGMELSEPDFFGGDQVATMTARLVSVESLTTSIYSVRGASACAIRTFTTTLSCRPAAPAMRIATTAVSNAI
jgi:hypothetical protein